MPIYATPLNVSQQSAGPFRNGLEFSTNVANPRELVVMSACRGECMRREWRELDLFEDRYAIDEDFEFQFDSNPPAWIPSADCWVRSDFIEQKSWLGGVVKVAKSGAIEAAKLPGKLATHLVASLDRQASHAEHIRRQVLGAELRPYSTAPIRPPGHEDDIIARALARFYGEDPRPEFMRAIKFAGIEPSEATIHAGGRLHRFHVEGDPPRSKNGWAILHRCPPFGVFGSWRTGLVRTWRSAYIRDEERTAKQIAEDIATAMAARDALAAWAA